MVTNETLLTLIICLSSVLLGALIGMIMRDERTRK